MPTDPRPAVATSERISGHQGATVAESVNAIAEHFGPFTTEQCREIAAVMEWREAWATRELPSLVGQKQGLLEVILRLHAEAREAASALRREREENADLKARVERQSSNLRSYMECLNGVLPPPPGESVFGLPSKGIRGIVVALLADRDRYRAALEFYAAHHTWDAPYREDRGTTNAEYDHGEVARLALAPPPPAAQAEGGGA